MSDGRCQVVIGEQHGEPVTCGAVEAIHGEGLGMVGGHDFDDHDHQTNVEVFGDCPVCDARAMLPPTAASGEALADEAIARASAAAPDDWTHDARNLLRLIAATETEFTTDDLWARLPAPPEPRAMGGIIRWGATQGLIVDTGRARKSTRPECHARPVTIWAGVALPDG